MNKSEWVYWALRAFLMVTFLSVADIDKKLLAKTMMCLGIVFACYFWYEFFMWSKVVGQYQFDGLCGLMRQHNYWAAAHFFVIPFCFYGVWKKLAVILVPIMAVHIILLHSRSAIAALAVTACIVFIKYRKDRVLTIVLGLTALVLLWKSSPYIFTYDSLHQRFEQWIPTLKMIWQNPLGVGAGNWWLLFPKYAPAIDFPDAYQKITFRFPHNDFLWVWAETGIFGIICYLGMFATALWSARKKTWLLIALLGYMTLAFFTACRERPFASLMMMVFIVMACEFKDRIKCYKEVLIPLTLLLVVLGFHCRSLKWNRVMNKVGGNTTLKMMATQGYSPLTTLTYTGTPYFWWRGTLDYTSGNTKRAMYEFEVAHKHNPYNVHVLNGMGIVRGHSGDVEGAKEYFREALRICPSFSDARDNLEGLEIRQ